VLVITRQPTVNYISKYAARLVFRLVEHACKYEYTSVKQLGNRKIIWPIKIILPQCSKILLWYTFAAPSLYNTIYNKLKCTTQKVMT